MDVSIIIVNYNTAQLTLQCIESIYSKTSKLVYEIIVVDNASTDNSVELIRDKFPNVLLVQSDVNLGFGRANNLAYQSALGNYIFLLNSDTILVNNAIYKLFCFLEANLQITIVGGQLLNKQLFPVHSYSVFFPSISWEVNNLLCGLLSKVKKLCKKRQLKYNNYFLVSYITGADMMIRRSVIDKLGLFDPDFFMYFEETEMSHRYSQFNHSIAFFPQAKIIHLEGKSISFIEKKERLFFTSRAKYYRKVHSILYFKLANLLYLMTCFTKILYSILSLNFKMSVFWIMRMKVFYSCI